MPVSVVYLTAFGILVVATATVACSSLLSAYSDAKDEEAHLQQSSSGSDTNQTINFGNEDGMLLQTLLFPVMASISLLTMFFFFQYMQYILFFFLTSAAFGALYQLMSFTIEHFSFAENISSRVKNYFVTVAAGFIVVGWIMTGYWLFHNILCISLAILFVHTLRFPSFKIVTLLLVLLVVYDGFWVFYSEYFFHKNVMVEVAKKTVSNPVKDVAEFMKTPDILLSYISSSVELPIKLLFPIVYTLDGLQIKRMMMLGLGDIILPGAAVNFALRCDLLWLKKSFLESALNENNVELIETSRLLSEHDRKVDNEFSEIGSISSSKRNILIQEATSPRDSIITDEEEGILLMPQRNHNSSVFSAQYHVLLSLFQPFRLSNLLAHLPFFNIACGSYFLGLFCAFVANFVFNAPQPALIYIVPSMLLSIAAMGLWQKKLTAIWEGLQQWEKKEIARHHLL